VGEHRAAAQVAERPHVLGFGAQRLVDGQEPARIWLQAQVFQAQLVGVGDAAGGDEQVAAGDLGAFGAVTASRMSPAVPAASVQVVPVSTVTPSAVMPAATAAEISGSSAASSRSARWITVTFEPKRANTCANSQPT
jgi:hypothetical protein